MKDGSAKALVANLSLSLAAVILVGGGLEGAARLVEARGASTREDGALPDWKEGWGGADFYVNEADPSGWPPLRRFNNEGLRDRCRPVRKPAGTRRIVCLGDSVTYGHRLKPAAAWPQALEALLTSEGHRVDVFNVALPAWSTRQEAIAYRRIARHYAPDQVLLGVCLNDLPELQTNLAPPPRLVAWFFEHSALVRGAVNAPRLEQRSVEALFTNVSRAKAAFDFFAAEVRALRAEVEADGATLALVVFPFRFQLEGSAPAPVIQERFAAFCRDEGLPCLDLLPALKAMGPGAFLDHDHLTAEGSAFVAQQIAGSSLVDAGPSAWTVLARAMGRSLEVEPAQASDLWRTLGADGDPAARAAAAWALGGLTRTEPQSSAALTRALADPEEGVRLAATRALGTIGPAAGNARAALYASLSDPCEAVRWEAALALSLIGARPDDVRALVVAFDSPDPQVRAFALETVESLGAAAGAAVEPLGRLLSAENRAVRVRAARALGGIGPAAAGAAPALVTALASGEPALRRAAARALGRIGPDARGALPALAAAKSDPEAEVRREAATATERILESPPSRVGSGVP